MTVKHLTNIAFFLLLLVTSLYAKASSSTLTILNWEEYLSPQVIELWEQKSGSTLAQLFFSNMTQRDEIINNNQYGNIDLIVSDEVTTRYFASRNLFAPLSNSEVPNLINSNKSWRTQCGTHSAPYFWGSLGLAYRSDKLKQPPNSWHSILQPEKYLSGHISMLGDYSELLLPSLFVRNQSVTSNDKRLLNEIHQELLEQVPFMLGYGSPTTLITQANNRQQLYLAMAFSGDEVTLNSETHSKQWKFTIPKEGTLIWVDCLAVAHTSKQKQLAYDFINFLNRKDIAKINAQSMGYASTTDEHTLTNAQFYSHQTRSSIYEKNTIAASIIKSFKTLQATRQ